MKALALALGIAVVLPPRVTAQRVSALATEGGAAPFELYNLASAGAITGALAMTLINLDVFQPQMSEGTRMILGLGAGWAELILGYAGLNVHYDDVRPKLNVTFGAMAVASTIVRAVRVGDVHLTPWRDAKGRTGASLYFAF